MLRRAEQSSSTSKKTMVPTAGLEPAQVAPLAPQTSASTNFATSACLWPDGQKSSWAAPKIFMGCAQTFLGVRRANPVNGRPCPPGRISQSQPIDFGGGGPAGAGCVAGALAGGGVGERAGNAAGTRE